MIQLPGYIDMATGILLIILSIPLILKKIKMNHFYGIRIAKAFESDENWYAINALGGKALAMWGVVLVIFGVLVAAFPEWWPQGENRIVLLSTVPILACVALAIVQTFLLSRNI